MSLWSWLLGRKHDNGEVQGLIDDRVQEESLESPDEILNEIDIRRARRRAAEVNFKKEAASNLQEIARELQGSGFVLESVRLEQRVKNLERQMNLIRRDYPHAMGGTHT